MLQIRKSIFETNSSSTHAISFVMDILTYPGQSSSSEINVHNCPTIELLALDKFYFMSGDNIFEKLSIILTDGVLAHPEERAECLNTLDKLFSHIKKIHGKQLEYDISALSNKPFIKNWEENYSDGNANPFIFYPLVTDSKEPLIDYLRKTSIRQLDSVIKKEDERIKKEKTSVSPNDIYDTIYDDEYVNKKRKLKLKFMKSGHKWSWTCNTDVGSPCRIKNLRHLYEFVIDDRFSLQIGRD